MSEFWKKFEIILKFEGNFRKFWLVARLGLGSEIAKLGSAREFLARKKLGSDLARKILARLGSKLKI